FLIQAYISLYQATFDESWLSEANRWTEYTQAHFFDATEGYFHFSGSDAEKLIARKKEIFDNVIPSSNGVMARNLYHLGILLDNEDYKLQAEKMVSQISKLITSSADFMSHWGILYSELTTPMAEIVIVGPLLEQTAASLRKHYLPYSLIMGTTSGSELPLIAEKTNPVGEQVTIYVCFNKTCKLPVHNINEALRQIPTHLNQ
ncbi:MAG: thioredoxin domain-containing protein, partial [Cyclobacteriaceae bacterium]